MELRVKTRRKICCNFLNSICRQGCLGKLFCRNLQRLLRVQKRCARLDATIYDNSVERFDELVWLPKDDIVGVRKLFMLHKISQGHCPEYFSSYFKFVRSIHNHRTRSATCNDVLTPSCKRNSGLRTFHSSTCRLWNNLGNTYRNIISHSNFRITLQKNFITENSSLEYFKIIKTF